VKGKPPAAPSGPHDCEDVHVRARPIRLSTAECKEAQPLSTLLESTAQRPDNHRAHDNKDNQIVAMKTTLLAKGGGGSEDKGGDNLASDAHNQGGGGEEEGSDNLAPAEVTPHKISRCTVRDCSKPLYLDSLEAAILFGFNEGEDVYVRLKQRVTFLK
jgi:hypothetical protein